MMKKILARRLALLLACALAASTWAAQTKEFEMARLSDAGAEAYQTLTRSNWFSIGGVGFTGQLAPQEKAFQTLAREREADAAFRALLSKGQTGGQLYALLWLSLKDKKAFEQEAERFKKSDAARQEIESAQGCLLFKQAAGEIVAQIERGQYKYYANTLRLPGETNAQP